MKSLFQLVIGGALSAVPLVSGCVGNIGDNGPAPPTDEVDQALCADDPFVRRLTVSEYINAVESTFAVPIGNEARQLLPRDLRADGFGNTSGALIVTLDHVEAYDAMATTVVTALGDMTAFASGYTDCTTLDDACATKLVEALALTIYRAPPEPAEVAELVALFEVVRDEGDGFDVAVSLVLRAMLQSPRFLYRVEHERGEGEVRDVDAYAMASRLSFLVWGSPPDADLREAAAADALATDEQLEAQVRRMLKSDRARETSRRYLSDWLHLDRLDNLQRDVDAFPSWNPSLAEDMKAETLAYWEYVVWEEGRPLSELFNTQRTFLSPELADHYGMNPSTDGDVYDLSGNSERGGLLTQGSVTTVGGNTASMVTRGLYILETFLCGEIGSPPPGVDTTPPPIEPGASQRSTSEARVDNPSCGGCHTRMEPLAWALERYDGTGAYAESDPFGNALSEDGSVIFPGRSESVAYSTTSEFADLLAQSDEVQSCMANKSTQFAMGRPMHEHEQKDACTLEAIDEHFLASDRTYADLLVAIALSPAFRRIVTRTEED